jgi:hypothetical protein
MFLDRCAESNFRFRCYRTPYRRLMALLVACAIGCMHSGGEVDRQ